MGAANPASELMFSNMLIAKALYVHSGPVREGVPFVCF
jgi:hypothetical protein